MFEAKWGAGHVRADPGDALSASLRDGALRRSRRSTRRSRSRAFAGMFACVLGQVVFRYFLDDPLVWSDELARYLFVWCVVPRLDHRGAPAHASCDRHRWSTRAAAARGARACRIVGALVGARLRGAAASSTAGGSPRATSTSTTATLFFTMGVVYAIVPVAALAVGLYALADARAALRALAIAGPRA